MPASPALGSWLCPSLSPPPLPPTLSPFSLSRSVTVVCMYSDYSYYRYRTAQLHSNLSKGMLSHIKGLFRYGRPGNLNFKGTGRPQEPLRRRFSTTFPFLLIFAPQRCSLSGFLMLSCFSPPVCLLAPPSSLQPLHLVLDPVLLVLNGFHLVWVVSYAFRLLVHSPFNVSFAPLNRQPISLKPCLVFKDGSSFYCAVTPLRLSFSRYFLIVFASAKCGHSTVRVYSHREPLNSFLSFCSILQLYTFGSFDWILLFPLSSNYFGVLTWCPVVSCSGVSARLTGAGVQQSRPS